MPIKELNDSKRIMKAYVTKQSAYLDLRIVEFLKKTARQGYRVAIREAGYINRTGNLQSSIGAIVSKEGKEIHREGFKSILSGQEGRNKGIALARKYMPNKGYGLIFVAGVHYSFFVENLHGLNVLAATELYMNKEFVSFINKFKNDGIRTT